MYRVSCIGRATEITRSFDAREEQEAYAKTMKDSGYKVKLWRDEEYERTDFNSEK